MKRKLYLDIALLVLIFGGFGIFVSMQHAPATDIPTQEFVDAPATGCCGSVSKVEGETSPETAGCCGTSASETAQSSDTSQLVQSLDIPEIDKTSPKTPQSDDADTGGCGCGSQ